MLLLGVARAPATPKSSAEETLVKKHSLHLSVLALAVCSLTGCSEPVDREPEARPTSNIEAIDLWIEYAKEDERVLTSQMEVLERARAAGEVTRADLDGVFVAHLECLDAAGVAYNVVEEQRVAGSGFTMPGVTLPAPDLESTREIDVDDACMFAHDAYVAGAYANQPWVLSQEDAVWTSQEVRDCLAARGYPTEDDMTAAEIRELDSAYTANNWNEPDFDPCVTNEH